MNEEEINKVLEDHKLWVESDGNEGRSANLQNADLRGADLDHVNLRNANLRGADLRGADLDRANLLNAKLLNADLRDVDLLNANLQGVNFRRADLRRADLRDANLQKANLQGANLEGADLRGADLQGAHLFETHFGDAKFNKQSYESLPEEIRTKIRKKIFLLGDYTEEFPYRIEGSIEFEKQYYQAGMSILSNFRNIVIDKYPKEEIKIGIEQEGDRVRMFIYTLKEDLIDDISKTFNNYRLAVRSLSANLTSSRLKNYIRTALPRCLPSIISLLAGTGKI